MGHERVANEHDLILSPSDCGQKIGKIAIARNQDYCGWRCGILDESHDIHWKRYQHCSVASSMVDNLPIIIKSTEFFPLLWGQSVGSEVSEGVKREG